MKTLSKILGVAVLALITTACGSNAPVNPALTNGAYGAGVGGVGVGGGYGGAGGCVPIQSGSLSFSAQGALMTQAVIRAGNLAPMGMSQYGQVVMGGGLGNVGVGGSMIQYQPKQSQNGTIQITASMASAMGGQGMVSGMIQLNPSIAQQIAAASMGYSGMYPMNGTVPNYNTACVNSLGIDIVQTLLINNNMMFSGTVNTFNQPGMGQINQAMVYLYMNSGQPIGPIAF